MPPDKIRQRHAQVPWEMAGVRDKLIHFYFGMDYRSVLRAIKERLPQVKRMKFYKKGVTRTSSRRASRAVFSDTGLLFRRLGLARLACETVRGQCACR